MWVAKFRAWHDSGFLRATESLEARLHVYYLNIFNEKRRRYISKVALVEGQDSRKAVEMLVQDPRCHLIEATGNQVFYYIDEREGFHNLLFDHRVFFVGPAIVEGGREYWTVASHQKRPLLDLYKNLNRLPFKAKLELLGLHRETPRFFASSALDDLTELERQALETARECGYYDIPRRMSAKQIARHLRLPVTTFSERLRKAEAKLVPAVLDSR